MTTSRQRVCHPGMLYRSFRRGSMGGGVLKPYGAGGIDTPAADAVPVSAVGGSVAEEGYDVPFA